METAIDRTGFDRSVILRAMENLQEKGHITLQMAGYRQRFKRIEQDVDRAELCARLTSLFERHEQQEIARINGMVDYAQEKICLTKRLLSYFGEQIAPCGHCGVCRGDAPVELPQRHVSEMAPATLEQINVLAREYPDALGMARQKARFLCGLNSPKVSAERTIRGNSLFGACGHIPFKHVLGVCRTLHESTAKPSDRPIPPILFRQIAMAVCSQTIEYLVATSRFLVTIRNVRQTPGSIRPDSVKTLAAGTTPTCPTQESLAKGLSRLERRRFYYRAECCCRWWYDPQEDLCSREKNYFTAKQKGV